MKYKVDQYTIFNKGRSYKVLKFPRIEKAWAFDDYPEDDLMMLDGTPEFYQLVQYALAAMIADPSVIIYFLIKRPGYTGYRDHMTYDAILVRPELRFRRSEWYDLKGHLDQQHYAGKYTIHYDGKKLDDWWNQLNRKSPGSDTIILTGLCTTCWAKPCFL